MSSLKMPSRDSATKDVGWGQRLRQARQVRGIQTQEELARLLSIDRRVVSRWESGQVPQTASLIELANTLHLSLDWLLLSRGKLEQPDLAGSEGTR